MKKYGLLIFSLVFFAFGAFFFWNSQRPNRQASTNEVPPVSLNRAPSAQGNESELNGFIFAMKNKAAVDVNIKKIIAYAKVHPENEAAQLYAIFAQPIPLFKGIAWRRRMLVEPIDAAYIGTISWLRAIKRNNDRRAPHLDALFDYFTDPNPVENIQGQTGLFTSLAQFQDYMATKVSPVVYAQIKSCDAILKAHKNHNDPLFLFDAALIFGDEAGSQMTSQTQRDRKFMPGNLTAIMANMYERMGFGMYLASYNMEGLARFLNILTAQSFFAKKSDFKKGIISNVFDIHLQSPKVT